MAYKQILISIIIPVYNAEEYIDLCLQSILNQINDSIEVILINDGSKDNSKEKCKYYSKIYKNIVLINQENLGVSEARNSGLKVATGKYIAFVDSDDTIKPNTINLLLKEIENNSMDLIVWGIERTQHFKSGNVKKEIITHETIEYINGNFQEHLNKYLKNWYFNYTWNKLYKKSIIENSNLKFDGTMSTSEDLLFNSLYLKNCKRVKILNNVLYDYRKISETSLTRKYHNDQYEMQKKAYNQLVVTLESNNQYKGLNKLSLDDYYIKFAYTVIYNLTNKRFNMSSKQKKEVLKAILNDKELINILSENLNSKFNKIFYYSLMMNSVYILAGLSKAYKKYNYYVNGWYRD